MEHDMLVVYGGEVKALGEGRVGGYLIRFSTSKDPDLAGDFFTKDTDFGPHQAMPTFYHHGLDDTIGNKTLGEFKIGKIDDVGIWGEAQLSLRDEYEKFIYGMAEGGKLGWSSGTAGHLVRRKSVGKASQILAWPLGLDASLTPTPAEPRNSAMTIKAFIDFTKSHEGAQGRSGDGESHNTTSQGETEMTQDEIKALVDAEVKAREEQRAAEVKAAEEKKAAEAKAKADHEAEIKAAVQQALNQAPADNRGFLAGKGPAVLKAERGDSAVKAFGHFLKTGDAGGIRTGEAYEEMKTTYPLVEATQYQGQEAVPTEVWAGIVERRNELSIARAAGAMVIQVGSNAINVPIEKVNPDVFVIAAENNTYDQLTSQPLDKAAITIYNYTRTVSMGNQLLEDSVFNIVEWWMRYTARGIALTENTEFLVGDASGNPQGAVTGSTLGVTAAAATSLTAAEIVEQYFKLPAEYRDNVSWVMDPATEGALRKLTASTSFPFTGDGGYAGGTGKGGLAQGTGWLVSPSSKVYNAAAMDAIEASKKPVLVGNFEAGYLIADRAGLTVLRDPYSGATSGLTKIISSFRTGGAVVNAAALYHILTPSA